MARRKRKSAADRIKSLQDVRAWLKRHKKSDSRTMAIRYLDIVISGLKKPRQHALILTLSKADFIQWAKYKKNEKAFLKWMEEEKSNKSNNTK
jgi:hypothetical protein